MLTINKGKHVQGVRAHIGVGCQKCNLIHGDRLRPAMQTTCYKCGKVRHYARSCKGVTNGIRVDLSPSTMWFKDEPGGSCWASNTPNETHQNERNPKVVQAWDYTINDNLKELIGTTYTNKMHLLFDSLSLKNFTIKCLT